MNFLATIEKLHPDIVDHFLRTGESKGIAPELQLFLKQLQWAAEIYEFERNISRAARELSIRIAAIQKIKVNVRTCRARIYSAISYFSMDNNVAVKIWESDYADKYEDLAKLAIANNDVKTAHKCQESARICRLRASEASSKEGQWAPVFIISPDLPLEHYGFEKKSLKDIAAKNNEGFYLNLISSLSLDNEEKKRLLADAEITQFEELIEEEITDNDD